MNNYIDVNKYPGFSKVVVHLYCYLNRGYRMNQLPYVHPSGYIMFDVFDGITYYNRIGFDLNNLDRDIVR
jgi:hypothetical protein